MYGIYEHSLDAKGRLFIPAKLREELGDVFIITITDEPCLSAYTAEGWSRFEERFKTLTTLEQKKMRPLYTHAAKCELDSQGRILLPQGLRNHAGLTKDVTVVGVGDRAEFWDTQKWNAIDALENTPENIAQVYKEIGI